MFKWIYHIMGKIELIKYKRAKRKAYSKAKKIDIRDDKSLRGCKNCCYMTNVVENGIIKKYCTHIKEVYNPYEGIVSEVVGDDWSQQNKNLDCCAFILKRNFMRPEND